ncbi:SET domain-containing protein [Massarina eburnea CBS 473.64]|uniref:SET domain-containing protein n=1 Tax=Massarina eburnea CBS 473.64 TaxID=1395130 RepID=A0A6A6SC78_9PLEO|nr:SET domain-containing protein [Massarina eburnea CBS 473.64]
MGLPAGAPTSLFFEIRSTPHSGRAVFAAQDIPTNTLVWRCEDLTLDVLLREYRREVCGECFDYDRGRGLRVRDHTVGFAFCDEECQKKWQERVGEIGIQAWTAVEKLVKGRGKEDMDMVDADLPRPKAKEIEEAWKGTAAQAELIRTARAGEQENSEVKITKQHRKAKQRAIMQPISPDAMSFYVTGILWKHHNSTLWPHVLALAADKTPYHSTDDLHTFTRTYLHLLSILPVQLLQDCTPETLRLFSTRDSHNSFGIRSLEDDGSEFFGYGCWPTASYFNHSCNPSIEKKRVGRVWEFRTGKDVEKGDELCITYLSGEERTWSRGKRMEILLKNWGFECACERCEIV